jgi:hypothetical protein
MNKAQKFLLENGLDDIVLNAKQFPENTSENANKWIYLSDILEQYLVHNQTLQIQDVIIMLPKLEKQLEEQATLISEAISDIITIASLNNEETAIKLIREQFLVINREDIDDLL